MPGPSRWVERWNAYRARHARSDGRREASYTDAQEPSATDPILRFFLTHRLD